MPIPRKINLSDVQGPVEAAVGEPRATFNKVVIGVIRGISTDFATANEVYPENNVLIEIDTGIERFADGVQAYSDLTPANLLGLHTLALASGVDLPVVVIFDETEIIFETVAPYSAATKADFVVPPTPAKGVDTTTLADAQEFVSLAIVTDAAVHDLTTGINRSMVATASFDFSVDELPAAAIGRAWTPIIYVDCSGAGAEVAVTFVSGTGLATITEVAPVVFAIGGDGFFQLVADPAGNFVAQQINGAP
jgi:hypothetical protein